MWHRDADGTTETGGPLLGGRLSNRDTFIFDIGTGSVERISALQIPYNYPDKVS